MAQKPTLTVPKAQRELLDQYLPSPQPQATNRSTHLTLTYAQSLDAQISISPGTQTALSGAETKAMTHYLRARHDAILVGVGTAEADDPSLNCRYSDDGVSPVGFERQPRPLVLDPSGRWSCRADCSLLRLARDGKGKAPFWIVRESVLRTVDPVLVERVESCGGNVVSMEDSVVPVPWGSLLRTLSIRYDVHSLMVEGGGKVIEDLLRSCNRDAVQSVIVTIAPVWLGRGGVSAVPERDGGKLQQEVGRLKDVTWVAMGSDIVMAGRFPGAAEQV